MMSKLNIALYDFLNENSEVVKEKTLFCNACCIPFMTEEREKELISQYPGYHPESFIGILETKKLRKKVLSEPMRIENLPKGNVLFVLKRYTAHQCGSNEKLTERQFILHGDKGIVPITALYCPSCKKNIITDKVYQDIKDICKDYRYVSDQWSYSDIFPNQKMIYLLNHKQYMSDSCPGCFGKLAATKKILFCKKDDETLQVQKSMKECKKCGRVFMRNTSLKNNYEEYKYSMEFYKELPLPMKERKTVHVQSGDFLVRTSIMHCPSNGHVIEDILAVINVVTPNGTVMKKEYPAGRCNTCGKLYILEKEYQDIMKKGIPLCGVIDSRVYYAEHQKAEEQSVSWQKESILHSHGYNVNINQDLTAAQRKQILISVIDGKILSKIEICSHIDLLCRRAKGQKRYENALKKWEEDRKFVSTYEPKNKEEVQIKKMHHIVRVKKDS